MQYLRFTQLHFRMVNTLLVRTVNFQAQHLLITTGYTLPAGVEQNTVK